MGLEVSTYISGLTSSWPISGDPKNQGDDHLRLIKGALQATFPNASKPFYFPVTASLAGPTGLTLTAAYDKSTVFVTTAGGDSAITLPSGLTTTEAGWSVEVVKYSLDGNGAMVFPPSGTIISQFGNVANVRVGSACNPVRFMWSGSAWFVLRSGAIIGSTTSFDGAVIPAGYLPLAGGTFVASTFTELALALGTTVLFDRRGRVDIGAGTGTGLSTRILGTPYGAEAVALATGNLPAYTPTGTLSLGITASVNLPYNPGSGYTSGGPVVAYQVTNPNSNTVQSVTVNINTATFNGAAQGGASTPFGIVPPSIGTQKIIRAC